MSEVPLYCTVVVAPDLGAPRGVESTNMKCCCQRTAGVRAASRWIHSSGAEQCLQRRPEAGSSWPSWSKAPYTRCDVLGPELARHRGGPREAWAGATLRTRHTLEPTLEPLALYWSHWPGRLINRGKSGSSVQRAAECSLCNMHSHTSLDRRT